MSTSPTLKIEAIKHVLWVQDMERALAFYAGAFGLTERFSSPGWSELAWGDAIIALHAGRDASTEAATGLSIQVDDLAAACASVAAGGGSIVAPPQERPGEPIRLATIADTEGNELMLTQYVG